MDPAPGARTPPPEMHTAESVGVGPASAPALAAALVHDLCGQPFQAFPELFGLPRQLFGDDFQVVQFTQKLLALCAQPITAIEGV